MPFVPARRNPPDRGSAHQRRSRWPWRICVRCRPARKAASAVSFWLPHHQAVPAAINYFLIALIEPSMFEGHDALGRARLAFAHRDHLGLGAQSIAGEHRAWKLRLLQPEIADG